MEGVFYMRKAYGTACIVPYHYVRTKLEINVINQYSTAMTMDDIAKKCKITTKDVRHILYRAILTVRSTLWAKSIWQKLSIEEKRNECSEEQVAYISYLLNNLRAIYCKACKEFDKKKLHALEDIKNHSECSLKDVLNLKEYCRTNDAIMCPFSFLFLVEDFKKIKEMENNFIF